MWLNRQEDLISSLTVQPLILVVRPKPSDLDDPRSESPLIRQLRILHDSGLRHLELAWIRHSGWSTMVELVRGSCPRFRLGAASVNRPEALEQCSQLGLHYAMAP